jgi:hypothetical protein
MGSVSNGATGTATATGNGMGEATATSSAAAAVAVARATNPSSASVADGHVATGAQVPSGGSTGSSDVGTAMGMVRRVGQLHQTLQHARAAPRLVDLTLPVRRRGGR